MLLEGILFWCIPIILFAILGVSIFGFISVKRQNRKAPGTFSGREVKLRRNLMITMIVIIAVFVTIVASVVALLAAAVSFM